LFRKTKRFNTGDTGTAQKAIEGPSDADWIGCLPRQISIRSRMLRNPGGLALKKIAREAV
jgi:hypothetical protein